MEGKQGKKSKSKKGNKMRQSAANPAHSKKKVKGWNKPPHTFKKSVTLDHDDSSGIDGGNITSPTSDSEGADGEDDDDDEDNLSGVADLFGVDDLTGADPNHLPGPALANAEAHAGPRGHYQVTTVSNFTVPAIKRAPHPGYLGVDDDAQAIWAWMMTPRISPPRLRRAPPRPPPPRTRSRRLSPPLTRVPPTTTPRPPLSRTWTWEPPSPSGTWIWGPSWLTAPWTVSRALAWTLTTSPDQRWLTPRHMLAPGARIRWIFR